MVTVNYPRNGGSFEESLDETGEEVLSHFVQRFAGLPARFRQQPLGSLTLMKDEKEIELGLTLKAAGCEHGDVLEIQEKERQP